MATAFVHIGSAHAGSTTIQEFLQLNRERLARRGVCYPVAGGSSPFAAAIGSESAEDYRRDFARETAGATSVVISDEHLWGRHLATAGQIAVLRDLFAPFRVVVVCYIRRQDELMLSQYARRVYKGHAKPFTIPPEPHVLAGLDYHSRLIPWREAFGDVVVRRFGRPYFTGGDLIEDFAGTCGVDLAGLERPALQNKGLAGAPLEFVRRYNTIPSRPIREMIRRAMLRLSQDIQPSLDGETRRWIIEASEDANAKVAAMIGVDGPLFTHPVTDDPAIELSSFQMLAFAAAALGEAASHITLPLPLPVAPSHQLATEAGPGIGPPRR